jgi:hypothetical protein
MQIPTRFVGLGPSVEYPEANASFTGRFVGKLDLKLELDRTKAEKELSAVRISHCGGKLASKVPDGCGQRDVGAHQNTPPRLTKSSTNDATILVNLRPLKRAWENHSQSGGAQVMPPRKLNQNET